MQGLVVSELSKSFGLSLNGGVLKVLDNVSLTVSSGEIVGVIGPSGCGKTTLLRIVAGLVKPDTGECLLNGSPITRPRPDIGMVFQFFNLLPWRTAIANVEFGLQLRRMAREERVQRARQGLSLVGLGDFADYYPHQLSGGMQQRIGLARALAVDPALLLMDEPLGALDYQTAERLRDELLKIHAQTHKMVLLITHNIDEALYLSDVVLVFSSRPGRILRQIRPDFPSPRWEHDIQALRDFGLLRSEIKKLVIGA